MSLILLIIILLLVFGGGGGYYGYRRWGSGGGIGIVGLVLIILVVLYLIGGMRLHPVEVFSETATSQKSIKSLAPDAIFALQSFFPLRVGNQAEAAETFT